ncbi:putative uncharacterized protein FLJ44672 [Pongo pygmaeus]|uniref:putative uncharacterized protein FLJ44672 n=1 Tax=Pongo pygmaeus TaxID=9600 RepID=UPI00300C1784
MQGSKHQAGRGRRHREGGAGLHAGRQEAGRDLVPGGRRGATAGSEEAPGRQQRGLQRLFSSQSWACTGHREAGRGPEELGCRNFGAYKRQQELSQKSLLAGSQELGWETQPGGTAGPAEATMREAEAGPPQVGLSRPTCSLPASSLGPVLPPGCVSRPDSGLPTTSLDSAPAELPAALVGPQLREAKLPRPSSGLTVASPGSAPALRRRLQAPNGVGSVGSSWPSLGLPATSAGPSHPEVSLSRPSSGLPPRLSSSRPVLPPGGLSRPGVANLRTTWACRGRWEEDLGLERLTGGSAGSGAHAREQTPGRERPP